MKNYFEHKEQVKYVDGLLTNNQEWQWIIKYIEENFTLDDVSNWAEFQTQYQNLQEVLLHFVKIVEVCRTIPKIKNRVIIFIIFLSNHLFILSPI